MVMYSAKEMAIIKSVNMSVPTISHVFPVILWSIISFLVWVCCNCMNVEHLSMSLFMLSQ